MRNFACSICALLNHAYVDQRRNRMRTQTKPQMKTSKPKLVRQLHRSGSTHRSTKIVMFFSICIDLPSRRTRSPGRTFLTPAHKKVARNNNSQYVRCSLCTGVYVDSTTQEGLGQPYRRRSVHRCNQSGTATQGDRKVSTEKLSSGSTSQGGSVIR